MKNSIVKGLFWKVPLVVLAILILYFEVDAYTNTKGSLGELLLYPNQENAFLISATLTAVLGITLMFVKSQTYTFVLVGLICIIILLFYPIFDMQGVEHPF